MAGRQGRTEDIDQFILTSVSDHPLDIVSATVARFGISRQAVLARIRKLAKNGCLVTEGNTRARRYALKAIVDVVFEVDVQAESEEDVLWLRQVHPHLRDLPANVVGILEHAFCEMMNNAIGHSGASSTRVSVRRDAVQVEIIIWDDGVGIFRKIQEALGLGDARFAILELAKGRLTTDPENHTGEGIFFTTRMCDEFSILSGRLMFTHSLPMEDWLAEDERRDTKGTCVIFRVRVDTSRTAREVFDQYADVDDGFLNTRIPVSLARLGGENFVSRSQARRLLARVDRFHDVILDWKSVESIGPAFADEVFRVFQLAHPEVRLTPINANEAVARMIARARARAGGA